MKIQGEHLQYIQGEIKAVLDENPDIAERYETGQFPRADSVKDLQKRFCFDLYYAAQLTKWTCDTLYPIGINDEHIYSASAADGGLFTTGA